MNAHDLTRKFYTGLFAFCLMGLAYGVPRTISLAKSIQEAPPNDRPRIENYDAHR
ncbi:MAG: hypothetical protein KME18_18155 [Phormidium tanganyikae FI6-MK23]|jgi:hypothetical protein|nr:hypothetical protein [Phormidium tanganyikae FI6-MK23]